MNVAKVAISLDQKILRRLDSLVAQKIFRTRSEAVQKAIQEKLNRLERNRLSEECSKLTPGDEQKFADEGIQTELHEWPEY